jgi:hypothetical protein
LKNKKYFFSQKNIKYNKIINLDIKYELNKI